MPKIQRSEARQFPYVACVSWPRSGHHLLASILNLMFRHSFGYCAYYGHEDPATGCCGTFPCRMQGVINMSKQHDFGLKHKLPADHRLIVQVRKFDEAVTSNYELYISNPANRIEDSFAAFRKFGIKQAEEYGQFINKWVKSDRSNRLVLPYERLTSDPHGSMVDVLKMFEASHFEPCIAPALELAEHVSYADARPVVHEERGVKNRRDITAFRHYRPELFRRLNRLARESANRLPA